MKTLHKQYIVIFWIGLLMIFISDFFTKRWVVSETFEPIHFIEKVFYLANFQKNDGIAFGIDMPLWLQIGGSILIIYLLLNSTLKCCLDKKNAHFQAFLLGAIIGGGIGNLIDRAVNGFVVDFIYIKFLPLFNVADIGITVGLVLLFATILMEKTNLKLKK